MTYFTPRICLQSAILLLCIAARADAAVAYRAAVVEHVPVFSLRPVQRAEALAIMNKNLAFYSSYAQEAASSNVQIIVFPEDGLYGSYFQNRSMVAPYLEEIPAVDSTRVNPCTNLNTGEVLTALSCLARKYSFHVVANMGEKVPFCPLARLDDGLMDVCAIVAVRSTAKDPDRQAVAVQEAVRRLTTAAQRSAAFQLHQGSARFFTGGANSSASYAKPGYTPGSLQANLRILAPLTHRRRDLRSHPPDRPVRRQARIPRRGRCAHRLHHPRHLIRREAPRPTHAADPRTDRQNP